jgi:tRNA dimethylallyltransferase
MSNSREKVHIIAGPTASGKSKLAVEYAQASLVAEPDFAAVIINCDSMQIYHGLPVITAQPDQYHGVEHFLYGYVNPKVNYDVARWLADCHRLIKRYHHVVLVGGTGMYIQALTQGLSYIPDITVECLQHSKKLFSQLGRHGFLEYLLAQDSQAKHYIRSNDPQRMIRALAVLLQTQRSIFWWQQNHRPQPPNYDFSYHYVLPAREELYQNINARVITMLENGAINEVRKLKQLNLAPNLSAMKAIGIAELSAYLQHKCSLDYAINKMQQNSRRYAKRQYTWFKRFR